MTDKGGMRNTLSDDLLCLAIDRLRARSYRAHVELILDSYSVLCYDTDEIELKKSGNSSLIKNPRRKTFSYTFHFFKQCCEKRKKG